MHVYIARHALAIAALIFFAGIAHAALPKDATTLEAAVCFTGDASTYNPQCERESWALSTGGRYNPNAWEAALQIDLAKRHRCGYGANRICYAAVSAPNGKAAILKINDNGPLHSGSSGNLNRVIDLNEASMRYFSGGKLGNCKGLLKGVKVCLLKGNQYALGPVDDAERDAWNKKMAEAPIGALPPYAGPAQSGYPQTIGQAYHGNQPTGGQPYMQPQIAQPIAQPVGMTPNQYFNPAQPTPTGATQPGVTGSQTGLTTSSGEPLTSVSERIMSFLQGPTYESSTTSPIKFTSTGSAKAIVAIARSASTTNATSSRPLTQLQTFAASQDEYDAPHPATITIYMLLEQIRQALLRMLQRLIAL